MNRFYYSGQYDRGESVLRNLYFIIVNTTKYLALYYKTGNTKHKSLKEIQLMKIIIYKHFYVRLYMLLNLKDPDVNFYIDNFHTHNTFILMEKNTYHNDNIHIEHIHINREKPTTNTKEYTFHKISLKIFFKQFY